MPDEPAPKLTMIDDEPSPKRSLLPQIAVAVMLGVLGFAMTVQINQVETDEFAVRGVELVELLKSLDAANERVDEEIEELEATRGELENSNQLSKEAAEQATDRANGLAILAGTAPVEGPGVTLTVDDPSRVVDAARLLGIVQELRDAGAEAIAINGTVRVVAQTFFSDEPGGAIRVGGRTVSPPFVIEAIGDPDVLKKGIEIRGGVQDRLEGSGAEGTVTKRDLITITALADIKTPEYARGESDLKEHQ